MHCHRPKGLKNQHNDDLIKALLFVTVAVGAILAYPAEYGHGGEEHYAPAGYHFEYGVQDPHTHDAKTQQEHRDHDDVKGSYTIHDPDGTKRIVEYTASKKDGFQAVVRREGHAQHPAVYGDKKGDGEGGSSYIGVTHWGHGSGR